MSVNMYIYIEYEYVCLFVRKLLCPGLILAGVLCAAGVVNVCADE